VLNVPDITVGFAVFTMDGACIHLGRFRLSDYQERRAFAMRVNKAQADGYEVRTWNHRLDPDRYRQAHALHAKVVYDCAEQDIS
jgi:hypothetical protein